MSRQNQLEIPPCQDSCILYCLAARGAALAQLAFLATATIPLSPARRDPNRDTNRWPTLVSVLRVAGPVPPVAQCSRQRRWSLTGQGHTRHAASISEVCAFRPSHQAYATFGESMPAVHTIGDQRARATARSHHLPRAKLSFAAPYSFPFPCLHLPFF